MELTTKDWKEFKIGDLFDQIGSTAVKKPFDKRNMPEDEFIIPALSSKIDNNSSDDGYKRTGRGFRKIGNLDKKYHDILDVYKYGDNTKGIDIVEDVITLSGKDWNYDQHRIIDTTPTEDDFLKTVGDFLQFEISQIM